MPDSILLSTRPYPFPGRDNGSRPGLGFDLEGIHDPCRARQTQTERAASRIVVLKRRIDVQEAWALVDSLDLDTTATGDIFQPGHQQVAPPAAIFEDVASEFRGDGRDHGQFRCPK
jgi:hypothetical protein